MLTTKTAKSLAVSYAAFLAAQESNELNGIIVWGDALLEAQETTGVELLRPGNLKLIIQSARYEEQKTAA